MGDALAIAGMILGFAALVTAHVAIVAGLAGRPPRRRAGFALAIPPLAPYWALREGMRVRGVIWIASALVYAVAVAVASAR